MNLGIFRGIEHSSGDQPKWSMFICSGWHSSIVAVFYMCYILLIHHREGRTEGIPVGRSRDLILFVLEWAKSGTNERRGGGFRGMAVLKYEH